MPRTDYQLFQKFITKYLPKGFVGINRQDSLIVKIEEQLKTNKQFFYVGDVLQMKILFASNSSHEMFGINPEEITLATFFQRSHPKEQHRHNMARSKTLNAAQELFISKKGQIFQSSHFNQKNTKGGYSNYFYQVKLFYTTEPYETVFVLLIITEAESLKISQKGFHYYIGEDESMFRFPDLDMLSVGRLLSSRELEILHFIAMGFDSDIIAKKLFLSVNTVNTHRRNILKKTGASSTLDLIIKMQDQGVI
jgi:DNA-binding CsgD family transcriptional regulator